MRLERAISLMMSDCRQFRRAPKVLITFRLDRDICDWLREYGEGYSTRINDILRAVMARAR